MRYQLQAYAMPAKQAPNLNESLAKNRSSNILSKYLFMRNKEPDSQFNLSIFLAQIRMYNKSRKYKVLYFF